MTDAITASAKFRRSLTHYEPVVDEDYGCPLYGFDAKEMKGRATCEWWTFIDSFTAHWFTKFGTFPMPEIVRKARRDWSRYSMTGYEAFFMITKRAATDHGR